MVIRSSVVGLPLNPTTPQVGHLHFPLEGNKVNFSSAPGRKKSSGTLLLSCKNEFPRPVTATGVSRKSVKRACWTSRNQLCVFIKNISGTE
ncbi:hypothetical protein ABFA07_021641 [Porites harrisoni]